jgi:glutathione S-transferase
VLRINGVIDEHLRRANTPYLMGDECKYIDLMFVPYIRSLEVIIAPDLDTTGSKKFTEWKARLYERPAVKRILEDWAAALANA